MARTSVIFTVLVLTLCALLALSLAAKVQPKKAQPRPQPKKAAVGKMVTTGRPITKKSASVFVKFTNWLTNNPVVNAIEDEVEDAFNFFRDNAVRIFQLNKKLEARGGPPLKLSTKGPHAGMSRQDFLSKRLGRRKSRGAGAGRGFVNPPLAKAPQKVAPKAAPKPLPKAAARRPKRSLEEVEAVEQRGQPCVRSWTERDPQTGQMVRVTETTYGGDCGGQAPGGYGGDDSMPDNGGFEDDQPSYPPPNPRPWGPVAPQPRPPYVPVQPQPRPPSGPVSPRPIPGEAPSAPAPTIAGGVDLRSNMPPIADQGECGSCWSFGAAAFIEGTISYQKRTAPVKLSEQALVDCSREDNGCEGGNAMNAVNFVRSRGLPTAASYGPYRAAQGNCRAFTPAARVAGYVTLRGDQQAMQWLSTKGPVSAAVSAGGEAWEHYRSGVIRASDCDGSSADHAVVIVGYTTVQGVPVWIIRNSWGTRWGMGGYAYLQRGVDACAVREELLGLNLPA